MLTAAAGLAAAAPAAATNFSVVHITDVHIDPFYVTGAIAGGGCYCETHATCARMPASCVYTTNSSLQAGPFGEPDFNCATPPALWEASAAFLAAAHAAAPAAFVAFTGDFGEAGLSAACGPDVSAQQQILANIARAAAGVRAAHPGAPVYPVFGNHDTSPGDVFDDSSAMSWLYAGVLGSFGADFAGDTRALADLAFGGWYSTSVPTLPGLRVCALNANYYAGTNPLIFNSSSAAAAMGRTQLAWLNSTLAAAAAAGERVWILGHQPPSAWLPDRVEAYRAVLTPFRDVVAVELFGHDHVDEPQIVRECNAPPPPPAPGNGSIDWVRTPGVEWCSGANWPVGNVFGAGLQDGDAWCPLVAEADAAAAVRACEYVCGNVSEATCRGFTWYPSSPPHGACCMRSNTDNKPLNASSDAVCYEKPLAPGGGCGPDSAAYALHVLFAGPSLTEGYPATNPALRRYEASAADFRVLEAVTYSGNITRANRDWAFVFGEEYRLAARFGLPDVGAASLEALVARMAVDGSADWAEFYALRFKGYAAPECASGSCKDFVLALTNGTTPPPGAVSPCP